MVEIQALLRETIPRYNHWHTTPLLGMIIKDQNAYIGLYV